MAAARMKQRAKVEVAADKDAKPAYRLKGKRRPIAMTLPPEILEGMAAAAVERDHSRAKMIEIVLRDWLRDQGKAA